MNEQMCAVVMCRFPILLLIATVLGSRLLVASATAADEGAVLNGLRFVGSPERILKEGDPGLMISGVQVEGLRVIDDSEFKARMRSFIGREIVEAIVKEIQTAVRGYYRERGFPLVDPVFPPQTVANGVLQVLVIESKLGKVTFEGTNKWTTTPFIRRSLGVAEGEPVNEMKLLQDVQWLNRNRFRSVDVFYRPGDLQFETDLVVRTADRFPFGPLFSYDNTGNSLTGEDRFSVGFEWGKAFGLHDHILSYRYSADLEMDLLQAHSVNYTMLLPWRHTLSFAGAYADVQGDIPNSPITQEGQSYLASVRYGVQLPQVRDYRHELTAGLEFKHFDNNLQFNFVSVLEEATEVAHASVGYTGLLADSWGSTFAGTEFVYSPGGLTERNDDTAFSKSYPFAESEYLYGRFNLERLTRLAYGFTWRASGMYQWADGNLVPSEQLGLGGAFTVRGFDERVTSGSEGYLLSTELRTPPISPGRWLDKTANDELQFLGFIDYGEISNPELQRSEDPHVLLISAGAGFRYRVSRFFTVRFDYGWRLNDPNPDRDFPASRGHAAVELRF